MTVEDKLIILKDKILQNIELLAETPTPTTLEVLSNCLQALNYLTGDSGAELGSDDIVLAINTSSTLSSILSTLNSIKNGGKLSSIVDRSGVTTPSPNTWTEVCPENINRKYLSIQNISYQPIEVGYGANGNEIRYAVLDYLGDVELSNNTVLITDRIVVRGTSSNQNYLSTESIEA